MHITSPQNPKIKYAARLSGRHFRDQEGRTILEGYRILSRALESSLEIEECFYCPEMFLGKNEDALLAKLAEKGAALFEVSAPALAKLAYRDRPEGLIGIAKTREHRLAGLPSAADGLYVVAETIEKPGNLGSILRSADAAGVAGVIVCDKRTDIYNPNVITASTGTVFSMPIAEASSQDALGWLRERNIATLAASPHAEKAYTDADLSGGIAIVVGAEQFGLSDFWMRNADVQVRIPMHGKADSLNVATAATIILFEAARQRGLKNTGGHD